jgi:hypothetical protein
LALHGSSRTESRTAETAEPRAPAGEPSLWHTRSMA